MESKCASCTLINIRLVDGHSSFSHNTYSLWILIVKNLFHVNLILGLVFLIGWRANYSLCGCASCSRSAQQRQHRSWHLRHFLSLLYTRRQDWRFLVSSSESSVFVDLLYPTNIIVLYCSPLSLWSPGPIELERWINGQQSTLAQLWTFWTPLKFPKSSPQG
jgi:hypothetical protein